MLNPSLRYLVTSRSTAFSAIRSKHSILNSTFFATDVKIIPNKNPSNDRKHGTFGEKFTDNMLEVNWNIQNGWQKPIIKPLENFSIHPAAKVFHHAIELFEGLKAFRGADGKVRIFRMDQNMERMRKTAFRSTLPDFDPLQLALLIKELVKLDIDWTPSHTQLGSALYIRPTFMGTEARLGVKKSKDAKLFVLLSPYHVDTEEPVSLLADPSFTRASPGGVGAFKMGSNYGPTYFLGEEAEANGCEQVLWLHGSNENLTEVGTMNIFVYLKDSNGNEELVTPPLDGLILPGITRDSLITLAKESGKVKVSEREITMAEIRQAIKDQTILGIFGSGTAVFISPVNAIKYRHADGTIEHLSIPYNRDPKSFINELKNQLFAIQYGEIQRPGWITTVN